MMMTRLQPRFASLHTCNPFEGLAGFRRIFDEPLVSFLREGMNTNADEWKPLLDVVETKDGISLKVDVPGVKQEDINISIEDNMLTVKGERKNESEVSEEGYHQVRAELRDLPAVRGPASDGGHRAREGHLQGWRAGDPAPEEGRGPAQGDQGRGRVTGFS